MFPLLLRHIQDVCVEQVDHWGYYRDDVDIEDALLAGALLEVQLTIRKNMVYLG